MTLVDAIFERCRVSGVEQVEKELGLTKAAVGKILVGAQAVGAELQAKIQEAWGIPVIDHDPEFILQTSTNGDGNHPKTNGEVCILLPVYEKIYPQTHICITSMMKRGDVKAIDQKCLPNHSDIARARNWLTTSFLLDSSAEWSLWIDSDMIFPCGNSASYAANMGNDIKRVPEQFRSFMAHDRLKGWGKTIVSGTYFPRNDGGQEPVVGFLPFTGIKHKLPHNALHPIKYAGMGTLLVHRSVYTDIMEKFPETTPVKMKNPGSKSYESGFFTELPRDGGGMMGEDESFMYRANEAGHPTYLDLGCILGHLGTRVYGVPDKYLK